MRLLSICTLRPVEEHEVAEFAQAFRRFLRHVNELAGPDDGVPLRATLETHLGRDPLGMPVVADRFLPFEHVNVQVALDAWLAEPDRSHELVGLLGEQHSFMSFADLVQNAHRREIVVGAVDYVSLADGPGSTRMCAQAGLYLIRDQSAPAAILLRGPQEHGPHQSVSIEVLATDAGLAERIVVDVRRLSIERSVFRNQVVAFAAGPFGEQTAGPIAFHARPALAREDVILPERTFAAVEEHVFGIAKHRDRLRASGQHVKRGLLLHGPPGTGKTLTTRYLIGRLVDHTVVLLSGAAFQYIEAAATLARSLQPALVVLEDVDLVANERMPYLGRPSPLLFSLLNVMDGLDEDADLIFLLTTNRADALEPALAARPGRVDQAVEISLPDADGRRRLLGLYGAGVALHLADTDAVVARTEGVTASFIKELVRKAALIAARADGESGRLAVSDSHVSEALDMLLEEDAGLTRALLGIGRETGEAGGAPAELPSPGGWFAYAPHGRPPPVVTHFP
jgi:cell division protease FtsH